MADPVRAALPDLVARRGATLRTASLAIGRNETYLQQYVARGSPRRLPELDRRHLAMWLEVDERVLGARDPWVPHG